MGWTGSLGRRQNTEDGFTRNGGYKQGQPRVQANAELGNIEVVGMGVFNVFLRHVLCCVPLLIGFYLVW
jgi:hypothetical protein